MNKFFSIIVPIYKVEEYLPRCVESVLSQDERYELILVDDGSPDHCGTIAESYAKDNERIKVIHKENGGLSDARNAGLETATGEYIIFLDADDTLLPSSLRVLADHIAHDGEADIYYANVLRTKDGKTWEKRNKQNLTHGQLYSGLEALYKEVSENAKYMAMAQAGIYRRTFLEKHHLRFKKGILHEDEEWSPRVALCAEKVMYLDVDYYRYLVREGSITTSANKVKNAQDLISTCAELRRLYASVDYKNLRDYLECYLAKVYIHAVSVLKRANESVHIEKSFTHNKWLSIKDFIRFMLFEASPALYACFIDKNFIKQ